MQNPILAVGLSNPVGNWASHLKGGWNAVPSAPASATASHTGLIMIVLVGIVFVVILAGLKKIAS